MYYLNPYLHDGTEHKRLIAQRFKKYPLNLGVKTGFFNSTAKPVSYTLYPPWRYGFRNYLYTSDSESL